MGGGVARWRSLGALLTMTALVACSASGPGGGGVPGGLEYRVRRGDTLYRIGKAYGVSHLVLARANGIPEPDRIEVGQVLRIPEATRPVPVQVVTPIEARDERPAAVEVPRGSKAFLWPVAEGTVTSPFGPRGVSHHDGIDITCEDGAPIRAARAGRVLYADQLRGYGNLVILEHGDGYVSVYAHNHENRVDVGRRVAQGETIGTVGRTGKTTGPNLHFEIRKDNIARNPLFYLPPRQSARERSSKGRGA